VPKNSASSRRHSWDRSSGSCCPVSSPRRVGTSCTGRGHNRSTCRLHLMGLPCQVSGALKKSVTGSGAGPDAVSASLLPSFRSTPRTASQRRPSVARRRCPGSPTPSNATGEHHDRSTDTTRQHPHSHAPPITGQTGSTSHESRTGQEGCTSHESRTGQEGCTSHESRTGQEGCTGQTHRTSARDTARTGQPGTETNKDRTLHFDVGPLEIDIPRTLGYYGGISAAVAFGVLEPPIAVFIAALPVIKMLGTRVAPPPLRFFAQVLQGAGKPVGSDGQGTIRLNDPDRARHDIDHITSGSAPSKNPR